MVGDTDREAPMTKEAPIEQGGRSVTPVSWERLGMAGETAYTVPEGYAEGPGTEAVPEAIRCPSHPHWLFSLASTPPIDLI